MRSDKFIRIAKKYYFNEKLFKKERNEFIELADEFRSKEDISEVFIFRDKIINKTLFFEFLSNFLNRKITSIDDLDIKTSSNKENIKLSGDSKHRYFSTTKDLIIIRKQYKRAEIYYKEKPKDIKRVVAVENMSSFFKLDFELFRDYEYFIYLGGFSNGATREFLKDKEVLFFVDFDFFGIKIFNSIKTKKKEIFLPDNIEELIKNSGSQEKYLKQNCEVELNSTNSKKLYELIKKHSKILFQEILDVN